MLTRRHAHRGQGSRGTGRAASTAPPRRSSRRCRCRARAAPARRPAAPPAARSSPRRRRRPRSGSSAGGLDPLDERPDDRALVAGGEIGAPSLELGRREVADGVEQRRLEPREREVEPRHACDREVVRLRVALGGRARRSPCRPDTAARAAARPCRRPRPPRRRASYPSTRTPTALVARRGAACARRSRAGR